MCYDDNADVMMIMIMIPASAVGTVLGPLILLIYNQFECNSLNSSFIALIRYHIVMQDGAQVSTSWACSCKGCFFIAFLPLFLTLSGWLSGGPC